MSCNYLKTTEITREQLFFSGWETSLCVQKRVEIAGGAGMIDIQRPPQTPAEADEWS